MKYLNRNVWRTQMGKDERMGILRFRQTFTQTLTMSVLSISFIIAACSRANSWSRLAVAAGGLSGELTTSRESCCKERDNGQGHVKVTLKRPSSSTMSHDSNDMKHAK